MPTIEEVTDILKLGYVDVTGRPSKFVDIYNVVEDPAGTFKYDATIFYPLEDEANSDALYASLLDHATFNTFYQTKVVERNPDLAGNVTTTVDNESGRFSKAGARGLGRPNFDTIIPSVQADSFTLQMGNPDYIEIKNIVNNKSASQITTSFTVHTNLPATSKLYWRTKLTTQDLSGDIDFDAFLRVSTNTQQNQSYFNVTTPEKTISNKTTSQAYTDIDLNSTPSLVEGAFNSSNTYYVYIMVYADIANDFATIYKAIV